MKGKNWHPGDATRQPRGLRECIHSVSRSVSKCTEHLLRTGIHQWKNSQNTPNIFQ